MQIFSLTSTLFICRVLSMASLYAQKCLYLCFHTCSSPISSTYFLGNSALHQTTTCCDRIIFSEDLSWSEHYKLMLQTANGHLRLLWRTFSVNSPVKVKRLLYLSFVRSYLTYGSQIWRPMYIKDIVILERIQKCATKYILNDRLSSYRSRLFTLNLLPLMYYLELMDILFLVKCLQFPDPSFDIKAFVSFPTSQLVLGLLVN